MSNMQTMLVGIRACRLLKLQIPRRFPLTRMGPYCCGYLGVGLSHISSIQALASCDYVDAVFCCIVARWPSKRGCGKKHLAIFSSPDFGVTRQL